MSKLIVIDPGHSGKVEPGAVSGEWTEAAINLQISQRLAAALGAAGFRVAMTRSGEIDTDDLAFRASMANELDADLFISIHCNSFGTSKAHGFEVWHYPGSKAGLQLSACICQAAAAMVPMQLRGVKTANFQVLRETICPAVLVECGFISNPGDRRLLTSDEGLLYITQSITAGVMSYIDTQ